MRRFAGIIFTTAVIFPLLVLRVLANSPPGAEFGEGYLSTRTVVIFLLLAVTPPIVITCLSERFVARLFGIDQNYNRLILLTNLISQISMWVVVFAALILLPGFVTDILINNYWIFLIAVELPIYTVEFLVYRKKIQKVSWSRCLLYAITANTASLLLGLVYSKLVIGL